MPLKITHFKILIEFLCKEKSFEIAGLQWLNKVIKASETSQQIEGSFNFLEALNKTLIQIITANSSRDDK